MFEVFRLAGNVVLNASQAITGLRNVQSAAVKTGDKLKSVGESISNAGKNISGFITLPILATFATTIKLASDMNETLSKTDVVFGENAAAVKSWANDSLKMFGLAKMTALDMVSTYADIGSSAGFNANETKKMSTNLVELTGDLASFKNKKPEEVFTALTGVYTGETEALKSLGISILQVDLAEEAHRQGIKKKLKEMTRQEMIQLRYDTVLRQSKNSVGDFARTQDSAANQMRIFTEGLKESGSNLGQIFLPYFVKAITFVNGLMQKFRELNPHIQKVGVIVAIVVAAIGPLIMAGGLLVTMIGTIITVIGAITTPVGIVILWIGIMTGYITAAVAAFSLFIWKSGILQMAIQGLKAVFDVFANILKGNIQEAFTVLITKFGMSKENAENFILEVVKLKNNIITFATTLKEKSKTAFGMFVEKIKLAGSYIYKHRATIMKAIVTIVKFGSDVVTAATKILKAAAKIVLFGVKVTKVIATLIKPFKEFAEDAIKVIAGLASKAYTWGKNLVKSLIAGLLSQLYKAKNAANSIADAIKSRIGWSSPTKEGPGSNSDEWGPNLISMIASGMLDKRNLIKSAATKIAEDLNFSENLNEFGNISSTGSRSRQQNLNGKQIILQINNPKFFNKDDVDKMMSPVITKLQLLNLNSY